MFNWSNNKTIISDEKFLNFKSNILAGNQEVRTIDGKKQMLGRVKEYFGRVIME